MKKFMKFIPVALGMLALASCSNDDLLGEKAGQAEDLSKFDLVVYQDIDNVGSNFTRGYAGRMMENYTWLKTDRIHVFDDELHKYDIYKFTACTQTPGVGGFHRENVWPNVNGQAKYALYPHEDVIRGYWQYNESSEMKRTVAEININPNMVFDATVYYAEDGKKSAIYKEVMPEWGEVEFNGDHLKTTLRYLTAGLQIPLLQYAGNATAIKVQVWSPARKEYLDIAGVFNAVLSEGNQKMIVNKNAVATYNEAPLASYFKGKNSEPSKAIYVDITHQSHDLSSLTADEQARAVLWVPLPDTDGEPVIIEISATNDPIAVEFGYPSERNIPDADRNRVVKTSDMWSKDYKPIWKSKEPKALEANKFYGPKNFYNFTVGGIDTNAINEALEDAEPVNKEVILETESVITVCGTDNTIIIPTERNADTDYIKIDMSNGLVGCADGETLRVIYEDPAQPFPGEVEIVGANVKVANSSGGTTAGKKVLLDADVPATSFAIAGDAFNNTKEGSLDIDAKAFSLGNGDIKTDYRGANLKLSDNVEELLIAEKASLNKKKGASSPDDVLTVGPSSKMTQFTVNGVVNGVEFDAHAAGEELDVLISGNPALYIGQIRTTGALTAEDFAMVIADQNGAHGVAAINDVTVTDKAFITGSIFSQEGDININNEDGDPTLGAGNGTLGDVIYERLGISVDIDPTLARPYTYGPLYAEGTNNGSGRVLVNAENTPITLVAGLDTDGNTVPATVIKKLNQHATDAVKYSVYAATDIQLSGDNITLEKGAKMWAENDIKLSGKTLANKTNQLDADHDFIIEGESKAATVNVGRKADVKVDPQNGKCDAILTLNFKQAEAPEKNMLDLTQGYIGTINNIDPDTKKPIDVELRFDEVNGAFAAIGTVKSPDNLLPQNESKWNGEQIDPSMRKTYVKQDEKNIWTATQLAAQADDDNGGITTAEPFLRSDINLMDNEWDGILAVPATATAATAYTFEGNGKYVSNFSIVSPDKQTAGFINKATVPVTVNNLTLNNVGSKIAAVPSKAVSYGTGALLGRANSIAEINRVKVTLAKGNFGSDGSKNIKSANIGGVLGAAMSKATFNGVQLDGKNATITGYFGLGAMIGSAKGGATFTDAPADDANNLEEVQTKVIAPKFEVTFVDVDGPLNSTDLNQGKTGLYIGTADLTKDIIIEATGNKYNDKFTVKGANEDVVWENGEATINSQVYTGKYSFNRMPDGKNMIQTLIGQSGISETDAANQKPVKIGNVFFTFYRGLQTNQSLLGTLYNVNFIDAVPKN